MLFCAELCCVSLHEEDFFAQKALIRKDLDDVSAEMDVFMQQKELPNFTGGFPAIGPAPPGAQHTVTASTAQHSTAIYLQILYFWIWGFSIESL